MRKIEWRNKALRQLRKIKSTDDRTLMRVFFTDHLEIIAVEEVKKRNERTYK